MKKENNNITELVFIIDKSGSMSGLESDTIGGFNSLIKKQKALPGNAYVSTVLFSNESQVLHDRKKLEEIEPLKDGDYVVGGCTALLDAIGDAIHHIKNVHKYIRPEDVPEKTMFVITTDGMENASRKYNSDTIKKLIKKYEKEHGWEFLFVAANIDAVETARNIGISEDRAANYAPSAAGTESLYSAMSDAVCQIRTSKSLDRKWREKLK